MSSSEISFDQLELAEPILKAVKEAGYEVPSPIQAQSIPHLVNGHDLLGQAQTGTGKTAAFALPLLSRIDLSKKTPQLLVLAPTRELAIQVAEAFQTYARYMKGFHVLPIYGGSSYDGQLRQLKRGVHVVVGTPGRVMDHMRRGTLKLDNLSALVLDEADEMLRMGFIDDVEWILEQTPEERQIALFSATMPTQIKKVTERYLNNPKHVKIEVKTSTADTIRQRYWQVSGLHKMDALTRILEVEPFDGMIIFVRTKTATVELAEKLEARGYSAAALNGDISQAVRERTVTRLKNKKVDILIATDVAARGLDVERISHVVNYDIPYDTEAYVHRIGRTGRAGRTGDAILFVSPREKRMLFSIEKATKQKIEKMTLPTTEDVNDQRVSKFKQKITDTLASDDLEFFQKLLEQYQTEHDVPAIEVAAALAKLVQGDEPLLLKPQPERRERSERYERGSRTERGERSRRPGDRKAKSLKDNPDIDMERYRIDVGYDHGVKPGNIVGAIANEANIEATYIGHIQIFDSFSTVDLPSGMPKETMESLKKVWVCQQSLNIAPFDGEEGRSRGGRGAPRGDRGRKPGGSGARKPRRSNESGSGRPTSRPADKKPRVRKPKED
ncbi:DEAD/DEAH box helicase [Alkalimarinus sediminis]|uniref:ATP-dependent RNA helicase DeaD n=1 Tax=Alkalimarinus sediminis TaxID=1632866 RepID=A0A9E8HT09_9ALTE|nr:DEAD/DEAH box helicase [Alkalimarinus sediminis]UZW75224.1 DEAD/DEAH box helicase [Alkalimarinus sediminis]